MDILQDPVIVKERIDRNLEELANLASEDRSRSRKEILDELSKDLAEYYGYLPELIDLFIDLFSPAECVQYIEASERPRPLVIRTNTLKTTRKDLMENLTKRGANVEAVEWSKVAIKITESSVPIGATPEYLAGHYMLQAASSLNPVMALAPEPGEKVLDMSSAPGGKTSYIAQMMKNAGFLLANDLKPMRQKATIANLHRLGVKNAVVCCHDGRKIGQTMKGFDRVLLDAPCSGMGIISRDPSVKLQRTVKDIERMGHLQKELLRTAIDVVNVNGVVVYSTCSISVEENEMVVNYILSKRHVKIVETGLQVGRAGLTRYKDRRFHPSVAHTRRFYPHVHNMDGFYVAKLVKLAHGERAGDEENKSDSEETASEGEDDSMDVDEEEEEEEEEVPKKKAGKQAAVAAPAAETKQKKAAAVVAAAAPASKKRKVEESSSSEEEDEESEDDESEEEEVVQKPVKGGKKQAAPAPLAKASETKATKKVAEPVVATKPAAKADDTSAKKKARVEEAAPAPAPAPVTRDFEAAKSKLLKQAPATPAAAVVAPPAASVAPAATSATPKSSKKAAATSTTPAPVAVVTASAPTSAAKKTPKSTKKAAVEQDDDEEEEVPDLSKAIRGKIAPMDEDDSDDEGDFDEDDEDAAAFFKGDRRRASTTPSKKKSKSISQLRNSASKKKSTK